MKLVTGLTDAKVRSAKPGTKRQVLADGRGLFLVVSEDRGCGRCSKAWEYRYRSGNRVRQMTIGRYPDVSLASARATRDEHAAVVASGKDPLEERQRAKVSSLTLADAAKGWNEARAGQVDDGTRRVALHRLDKHVLPHLGDRELVAVSVADLRDVLDRIVKGGTLETAHRTAIVLSQVFAWAEDREVIDVSPMRRLKRAYPAQPKNPIPAIIDRAAFGDMLRAIDAYRGRMVRAALISLALTFVRSRELREATWAEIDLRGATWTIPARRMKIKGNGDHVVPLSRQVTDLLRELYELTGPRGPHQAPSRCLVFQGMRVGRPLSDATLGTALTTMGFGPDVHRPHGFRSSASTMLNEIAASEGGKRFDAEHIEAQLAHRKADAVRATYARTTFLDQRRTMMQVWADACDAMRAAPSK